MILVTSAVFTLLAAESSPIEKAIAYSNRVFAVYLVILVMSGLVIAFLTWWSWKASNHVQDALKADADARIKGAEAIAAQANEGAAQANQQAAQANERANSLEHANLTLRSDLNSQYREVAALQIAAANARKDQQSMEIELTKQRQLSAEREKRDRIIRNLKVVLSFNSPGWQEMDSYSSFPDVRPPDKPGDPWQYLLCDGKSLPLRILLRHTIPQGHPRTRDASLIEEFVFELSKGASLVGQDIESLNGCSSLVVSVVSLDNMSGALTTLRRIHARLEINEIGIPFEDVLVNGPNSDLRDKAYISWGFSSSDATIAARYLKSEGRHP